MSSPPIFLVDTSAWIHLSRRGAHSDLADRAESVVAERAAAINQIIRVEMLVGCKNPEEFAANDDELQSLIQFPINQTTWDAGARLGFNLRRQGKTIPLPNLIIAASALEHDAIVLHADKHFDTIAQHSDLRVESYAEAQI